MTSIRTSTGRAVCGSVISTTMTTACSRSSHSTLVIRCRAVSSMTTESCRSRNRTGAHNSPGRGGTHSVTATSQTRRPGRGDPGLAHCGQICLVVTQNAGQHLAGVLAVPWRGPSYPASRLAHERKRHAGAQKRTRNRVVHPFPETPVQQLRVGEQAGGRPHWRGSQAGGTQGTDRIGHPALRRPSRDQLVAVVGPFPPPGFVGAQFGQSDEAAQPNTTGAVDGGERDPFVVTLTAVHTLRTGSGAAIT